MPRKRALLIGLDGCRPDALLYSRTPTINSLLSNSAFSFHATSEFAMSGPSWCSILTGHSQLLHRVCDNDLSNKPGRLPVLPTVLGLVKEVQNHIDPSSPATAVAVVSGDWDGIPLLCKRDADTLKWFKDCTKPEEACEFATGVLAGPSSPDVLFVYLDLIDHTGHLHGFGLHIPQYIQAIEQVDSALAPLIEIIRHRERQYDEDWLVVLTTDHGGSDRNCHAPLSLRHCAETWGKDFNTKGIHGMDLPQHRQTFFISSRSRRHISQEIIPAPKSEDVTVTLLAHFSPSAARRWLFVGAPQGLHLDLDHANEEATMVLPNWTVTSKL